MASGDRTLIREDVSLAPRTTLGVGGRARWLAEVRSDDHIREALTFAREHDVRLQVLGGGSNVVISDQGFDGIVADVRITGLTVTEESDRVVIDVGAGEVWDDVVDFAVARGLGGIECLSGIPGRVGAAPIQNVGAYGQEVAETVVGVRSIDRETGDERTFTNEECEFEYRQSRFKRSEPDRWVITRVSFALVRGAEPALKYTELREKLGDSKPTLRAVRFAVLALRRNKGMVIDPSDPDSCSVGSFFLNPVLSEVDLSEFLARVDDAGLARDDVRTFSAGEGLTKLSAAWLIEQAGFSRGSGDGNVGISSKHALALINRGGGSAEEILTLSRRIQDGVGEKFGIDLDLEPRVVA